MSGNELKVVASGERDLVITRAFDAPRRLVFEAHTRPELVQRFTLQCLVEQLVTTPSLGLGAIERPIGTCDEIDTGNTRLDDGDADAGRQPQSF